MNFQDPGGLGSIILPDGRYLEFIFKFVRCLIIVTL